MEKFFNRKTRVSYYLAVLVTFIHNCSFTLYPKTEWNNALKYFLCEVISDCAVPLFFVLSGAMIFRGGIWNLREYREKGMRRIKSLLIPYLIWNTVGLLFTLFRVYVLSGFMHINATFGITLVNMLQAIFWNAEMPVLWFMRYLLIFYVLSPIFYALGKNKKIGFSFMIAWTCLAPWMGGVAKRLPLSLLCYFMGVMIGLHYFEDFIRVKQLGRIRIVIDMATIIAFWAYRVVAYDGLYEMPIAVNVAAVLLNALVTWDISNLLFRGEKPKEFEKNSVMLYFMHPILLPIITNLLVCFMPRGGWFAIVAFVICNIVLYVTVEMICMLGKRFMPRIYGIVSGERV